MKTSMKTIFSIIFVAFVTGIVGCSKKNVIKRKKTTDAATDRRNLLEVQAYSWMNGEWKAKLGNNKGLSFLYINKFSNTYIEEKLERIRESGRNYYCSYRLSYKTPILLSARKKNNPYLFQLELRNLVVKMLPAGKKVNLPPCHNYLEKYKKHNLKKTIHLLLTVNSKKKTFTILKTKASYKKLDEVVIQAKKKMSCTDFSGRYFIKSGRPASSRHYRLGIKQTGCDKVELTNLFDETGTWRSAEKRHIVKGKKFERIGTSFIRATECRLQQNISRQKILSILCRYQTGYTSEWKAQTHIKIWKTTLGHMGLALKNIGEAGSGIINRQYLLYRDRNPRARK